MVMWILCLLSTIVTLSHAAADDTAFPHVPDRALDAYPFIFSTRIYATSASDITIRGLGFHVYDRAVLTAAHVVFDTESLAWNTNVKVTRRLPSTLGFGELAYANSISLTGYAERWAAKSFPHGFPTSNTFNADIAALYFTDAQDAWMGAGMTYEDNPESNVLTTSARKYYPDDSFVVNVQETESPFARHPTGRDGNGWRYHLFRSSAIKGQPGESGAPLYADVDGRPQPVALHVGGTISGEISIFRAFDSSVWELAGIANGTLAGSHGNIANAGFPSIKLSDENEIAIPYKDSGHLPVVIDSGNSPFIKAIAYPRHIHSSADMKTFLTWSFSDGAGDMLNFPWFDRSRTDRIYYRLAVYNGVTTVLGPAVLYEKRFAPEFIDVPGPVWVPYSGSAYIEFAVIGSEGSEIALQWYKDGVPLDGENERRLRIVRSDSPFDRTGRYRLRATNDFGSTLSPEVVAWHIEDVRDLIFRPTVGFGTRIEIEVPKIESFPKITSFEWKDENGISVQQSGPNLVIDRAESTEYEFYLHLDNGFGKQVIYVGIIPDYIFGEKSKHGLTAVLKERSYWSDPDTLSYNGQFALNTNGSVTHYPSSLATPVASAIFVNLASISSENTAMLTSIGTLLHGSGTSSSPQLQHIDISDIEGYPVAIRRGFRRTPRHLRNSDYFTAVLTDSGRVYARFLDEPLVQVPINGIVQIETFPNHIIALDRHGTLFHAAYSATYTYINDGPDYNLAVDWNVVEINSPKGHDLELSGDGISVFARDRTGTLLGLFFMEGGQLSEPQIGTWTVLDPTLWQLIDFRLVNTPRHQYYMAFPEPFSELQEAPEGMWGFAILEDGVVAVVVIEPLTIHPLSWIPRASRFGMVEDTSYRNPRILVQTHEAPPHVFPIVPNRAEPVAYGEDWYMRVYAYGAGRLEYQWFRDDSPIPGANRSWLLIEETTEADAGIYKVRVRDINGEAWSPPHDMPGRSTRSAEVADFFGDRARRFIDDLWYAGASVETWLAPDGEDRPQFGWFSSSGYPWIFHHRLGWIYLGEGTLDSFWFYDTEKGWCWSGDDVLPFFYEHSGDRWHRFETRWGFRNLFRVEP
ncbi:MAG: hypothetical protein JJU00_18730 [Opitutales bacterium]|nr:hypothetical protein [Opitutales bacterium]